jgi:hypothetical protein
MVQGYRRLGCVSVIFMGDIRFPAKRRFPEGDGIR